MNLLLDTHVALWAITDCPMLATKARDLILALKSTFWISVASVWEIAIKHALRCGAMPVNAQDALRCSQDAGYRMPAIAPEHAVAVEELPAFRADPFDRILVAQALVEPMRLMTHDAQVARDSDTIIKV